MMMRLDIYLVEIAGSRSKAVHLIKSGKVLVNGAVCRKQSYRVKPSDRIEIVEGFRYVSRGGYKIESLFQGRSDDIRGLSVLDVGCSAGGFSDFFLQHGAARVVGIDIAEGCVNAAMLSDPRFRFIGGVDARSSEELVKHLGDERFDLISVDVSNVSLREVLPNLRRFLRSSGSIVALFKPPYEIDGGHREEDAERARNSFERWLVPDFEVIHSCPSPIRGGPKNRGTVEHLYLLRPRV
ncbi:MAG: SAM-dependent methyltransferase [Methanothrix sp.]|jgi:23S rRNA (cytidine1920-2'-O)/16S rRNA (cytidine1409-2'-O)-methyltransferase|nr:SAM-dependent methyltransferase [Methanothrix sp.]